jgi:hypothetical protein
MSNHVIGIILVVGLLLIAALVIGIDTVRRDGLEPIIRFVKATTFVVLVSGWAILFVIGLQLAFTGVLAPSEVMP